MRFAVRSAQTSSARGYVLFERGDQLVQKARLLPDQPGVVPRQELEFLGCHLCTQGDRIPMTDQHKSQLLKNDQPVQTYVFDIIWCLCHST